MIAKLKNATIDRINAFADANQGGVTAANKDMAVTLYALGATLMAAQTVLFPAEQAVVFAGVAREYGERLDYALPFSCLLIEFMTPVPVAGRALLGLALAEEAHDQAAFAEFARRHEVVGEMAALPEGTVLHNCVAIFADGYERVLWQVANRQILFDEQTDMAALCKNLAIACVAYINCENITLEKQTVDEVANRKRAKKGKKQLEPFYLCRIRGVRYEASGAPGEGSHHGIRYDVRGHFRRLATGRMTWVRPHQRGVGNELYVPKIYKVDP